MSAVHLNKADFLAKVANYETSPNEWKFLGSRPALIDFMLLGVALARCWLQYSTSWPMNMPDKWISIR